MVDINNSYLETYGSHPNSPPAFERSAESQVERSTAPDAIT